MMSIRTLMPRWRARLATWARPAVVCLGPVPSAASVGDETPAGPQALVPAHDGALAAWGPWCEAHAGQRCHLALSGRWLLTWLAADGTRRPDLDLARTQAARQWEHYLGLDAVELASDWVLRLVRVPGGVLACAAPRALVDDVLAVAAHHGVVVGWMGPWWAPGVARWLADRPASQGADELCQLAAYENGWLTRFEARPPGLQRLWVEHAMETPKQAPSLVLGPQGLSDDPDTAALVRGRAPVWRASATEAAAS